MAHGIMIAQSSPMNFLNTHVRTYIPTVHCKKGGHTVMCTTESSAPQRKRSMTNIKLKNENLVLAARRTQYSTLQKKWPQSEPTRLIYLTQTERSETNIRRNATKNENQVLYSAHRRGSVHRNIVQLLMSTHNFNISVLTPLK
jgi:hypothetical protein